MQRTLILLVFIFAFPARAQVNSEIFVDGNLHQKAFYQDSLQLQSYLRNLQITWIDQGYYFAGIDSIKKDQETTRTYLHKGKASKARLEGFRGKKIKGFLQKELRKYVNHGFPFASISLDSVRANNEHLTGRLAIQTGPKITYDSAFFFNPIKTNHEYVYQLLDIVPGDDFSEQGYEQIDRKVRRSSFLTLDRPTDLSFKDQEAKVFLGLREEAANSFQGVLGLQQNNNQSAAIVGSLQLDIQNLFRSGKQLKFNWERFSEESQVLDIYYKHPFFLDSRISPSFRFELLKQDTTFLTRVFEVGVQTYISPTIELLLAFEQTNGTLLSTDLSTLEESGLSGFKRPMYKAQVIKGEPNSLAKLSTGIIWSLSTSAGRKQINRNLDVPNSYYDSLDQSTTFYQLQGLFAYQVRVLKRQAFFHQIRGGVLENDELLQNELFRLGGLNSLRGFNEKNLFAQNYLLSRIEFRSFFEESSYAYLFYDQLIYERRSFNDQPLGIGLGFSLATSAGQFSFALALGKSNDQPLSFETMKAHFGYISRF